jgi:hypothetical protein
LTQSWGDLKDAPVHLVAEYYSAEVSVSIYTGSFSHMIWFPSFGSRTVGVARDGRDWEVAHIRRMTITSTDFPTVRENRTGIPGENR